jgi:hypothetical protein
MKAVVFFSPETPPFADKAETIRHFLQGFKT